MVSYVATLLRDHADGRALPFATIDRARGQVVGATRFLDVQFWSWPADSPYQRGADVPDVVEIGGTWLAPSAQRTGINTEAKLLMLTHAFETWRVHRVSLKTDARNARSRAAILRLGARFDGILRAARVAADHTIRDDANYSILEGEWPEVKANLVALASDGYPSIARRGSAGSLNESWRPSAPSAAPGSPASIRPGRRAARRWIDSVPEVARRRRALLSRRRRRVLPRGMSGQPIQ